MNDEVVDTEPMDYDELLEEILIAVCRYPEEVEVNIEAQHGDDLTLCIHVAEDDKKLVIGKKAVMLNTLRDLFTRMGAYKRRHIFLRLEGEESREGRLHPSIAA